MRTMQVRPLLRVDLVDTLERLAEQWTEMDGRKPSISTLINSAIKTALIHQNDFKQDVTERQQDGFHQKRYRQTI